MNRSKLRGFAVGCLLALSLCWSSRGDTVKRQQSFGELHAAALSALGQHRLQDAEGLFQTALRRVTEPSPASVVLWNEIGRVHEERGRLDQAKQDYRRALDVNNRLSTPDDSQRAASMNDLGTLAEVQGRLPDAEQNFRQAIEMLHSSHSTDYAAEIRMAANLGAVLQEEHRLPEAADVYASAAELAGRAKLENDLSYAHLLVHSGMLRFQMGDFAQAIDIYRRALDIENRERNTPALDLANLRHNLAVALFQLDRFSEAAAEERSALEYLKTTPASDGSLDTLNTLALAEARMGQLGLAQEHAAQALRLAENRRAGYDPAVARAHNTVGFVAKQRGDRKTASAEFKIALKMSDRSTAEYAGALTNMAALEDESGHHKRAEDLYSEVLRIDEDNFGPNHPKVSADLCNLAKQKFYRKQLAEAHELYERAIRIQQKGMPPQSVELARAWHSLGVVLQAMNRLDEAGSAYQKATDAFRSTAPESTEYAGCLRDYAGLLRKQQQFAEAEAADVLATNVQVKQAIRAESTPANRPGASSFR